MPNTVTVDPCPECGGTEVEFKHLSTQHTWLGHEWLHTAVKMKCVGCGKVANAPTEFLAAGYDDAARAFLEEEIPYYWRQAIKREQAEAAELEAALRAFILFCVDGSSESAAGVFATLEEAQANLNEVIDTDGPPYIEEWRGLRCMNSWVLEDGEWVLDA